MAGSVHERILAAEMVSVMGIETLDALYSSTGAGFALPSPSQYFATMVVYAMLAGVAMFGERPGRLAGAFGGVAALAILLAPRKGGQPPFIIGALNYFNSIITGGTAGQGTDQQSPITGSPNQPPVGSQSYATAGGSGPGSNQAGPPSSGSPTANSAPGQVPTPYPHPGR